MWKWLFGLRRRPVAQKLNELDQRLVNVERSYRPRATMEREAVLRRLRHLEIQAEVLAQAHLKFTRNEGQ